MNKLTLLLTFFFLSSFSITYAQKSSKITPFLAKTIAAKESNEELTVWIYFTDKGENLTEKLATAKQAIGQRSLERRQRSMKDGALGTFYDIPVLEAYIEQVTPFLSKLRHQSKWLNAVSAKVTKANLQTIAAMNFVKSIDIVRTGKSNSETLGNKVSSNNISAKTEMFNLDYGSSLTQLEQMNVPIVHDLGYSGAGLIVCVLDAGFRNYDSHPIFDNMDIMDAYDFVNDDADVDDDPNDMGSGSHGLSTLSTIGGFLEGTLIGPAYGATYLLAKTENTDSETPAEEDNWVAAAEWAEALGADVTSTSLSYLLFDDGSGYGPADLDGNTATITIAGDIMAGLGVLVVNSAGNYGGGATTIGAPADGNEILAIGAVTSTGSKAGFSSVGPTADNRIKPDVMAMGVSVVVASGSSSYSTSNGTSFSCPLVAGAAAVLWEMVPTATNMEIFEALKMTADNAATPNNEYGWGIINIYSAFEYLTSADAEAPIALCENTTAAIGVDGFINVDPESVDGGSTDNISITSYELNNNTFFCADIGDIMVTLTVTDPSGNQDTCHATVTIFDNMLPEPTTANLSDVLADCGVNTLTPPTAIDNCAGNIVATTDAILPITSLGTTIVLWTYDDANGNMVSQTQNIVIDDATSPTIITQDITIDLDGAPSISITPVQVDAGSTDNCSSVALSLDIDSFTSIGEYTVTLSGEDESANIASESAVVTVVNTAVSTNNLFAKSLNVFPNPANDKIYLEFDNNSSTTVTISIYNVAGKLMKTIAAYQSLQEINLAEMANGMYVFQVKKGEERHFVKAVVAR